MRIKAITLAVAVATYSLSCAAMASDTTSGVRFNYSFNEPESRTRNVIKNDDDTHTVETSRFGATDHSTVTLYSNTAWQHAQSSFTVDFENFENNGDAYTETRTYNADGELQETVRVDSHENRAYVSANWTVRGDVGGMSGADLSWGPVEKVYLATKVNWAKLDNGDTRKRYWVGPTLALHVPYTSKFEVSAWKRDTLGVSGTAEQYIVDYSVPFTLAAQRLSFGGVYEYITGEGHHVDDWLETEHNINWHLNENITLSAIYVNHENMNSHPGYDYHQFEMQYTF